MSELINKILAKLGPIYGIVFKIAIPILVMFYPAKFIYFFMLSRISRIVPLLSLPIPLKPNTYLLFCFVIFPAFLIFLPKVASAIEFVLFAFFLIYVPILYKITFFSNDWLNLNEIDLICYIAVVVFLLFKLIFLVYLIKNRDIIRAQRERSQRAAYKKTLNLYR